MLRRNKLNKKTSILKVFIVGLMLIVIGILSIMVFTGQGLDNISDKEENKMIEIIHGEEMNGNQEVIIEKSEHDILNVSLNSAGMGSVTWSNNENIYDDDNFVVMFFITPEGKVLFEDDEIYPVPDDEALLKEMEEAIISKFEENKRAIYFLGGDMNKEMTEGVMEWRSHQRFTGKLKFTVNENGDIVADESDWNALPETDEKTEDDFNYIAELMIQNQSNLP